MKERKLKVYCGNGKDYTPIPQIILQGKWLQEMGFSIGDRVAISCQQEKLIIAKAVPAQK